MTTGCHLSLQGEFGGIVLQVRSHVRYGKEYSITRSSIDGRFGRPAESKPATPRYSAAYCTGRKSIFANSARLLFGFASSICLRKESKQSATWCQRQPMNDLIPMIPHRPEGSILASISRLGIRRWREGACKWDAILLEMEGKDNSEMKQVENKPGNESGRVPFTISPFLLTASSPSNVFVFPPSRLNVGWSSVDQTLMNGVLK